MAEFVQQMPNEEPEYVTQPPVEANPAVNPNFIERHKAKIIYGSAGVSLAAVALSGDAISDVKTAVTETSPALYAAYGGSMGAYFGGMAIALTAAGMKVNRKTIGNFKEEASGFVSRLRESRSLKGGIITNTVGAVGAAGVGGYAIVDALPPTSWGLLAIPALDLYSTYVFRRGMLRGLKNKDQSASQDPTQA